MGVPWRVSRSFLFNADDKRGGRSARLRPRGVYTSTNQELCVGGTLTLRQRVNGATIVWILATVLAVLGLLLGGCTSALAPIPGDTPAAGALEGKIVIFHAGSLTVPMKALTEAFQSQHPEVRFETEASGSNAAARKVSELGRVADLVATSDYTVIDKLLIPGFADWNIQFASNTMVIAHTDQSLYGAEVGSDNWHEILTREEVVVGRGNPDVDPCGYRTLLVWQLAEDYYNMPGLYNSLEAGSPPDNVRPKSEDLLALLQSGDIDYAWEYRSVAVQHGLKFVELPDEINLSKTEHADFYAQAMVEIAGGEPDSSMAMRGKPIVYGVTIPKAASRADLALEFLKFLIGPEGQAIMEQHGQPPIVPAVASDMASLPWEPASLVE